jgi:antirestriction protein ArdC
MTYYVRQLQLLQREILDSVDEIVARSKTPPVIVIQADEGFEVNPDLFGEAASQDIRVKGMSAFYLPGLDHAGVPTPPSSVNALRFVFNHYLGTHYEMLESVSHLEGDFPYDFTEISVR